MLDKVMKETFARIPTETRPELNQMGHGSQDEQITRHRAVMVGGRTTLVLRL
jgi:hypothetical protein